MVVTQSELTLMDAGLILMMPSLAYKPGIKVS